MTFTVTEPCLVGGCVVGLFGSDYGKHLQLPKTFIIPEGSTQAVLSMVVISKPSLNYATPEIASSASVTATLNQLSKTSRMSVYPPLGNAAADGSYLMTAFGASSRTGTGSITESLNDSMAKNDMLSFISRFSLQCKAAIPNGVLVPATLPVKNGEFKDASGRLTITYTQIFKCTK